MGALIEMKYFIAFTIRRMAADDVDFARTDSVLRLALCRAAKEPEAMHRATSSCCYTNVTRTDGKFGDGAASA